ncbi:XRE family transcriptional regulator [Streptomyces sp. NPDC018029]|uniref:MmyB family transcriptional regulator n=1 Tax=Streptomyces sp. NPDC018029 TaxID=3365032 RepID=UPI00379E8375
MHGVWRTVVEGVTGSMAYIADRRWNVVACNAEFEGLFPDGRAPSNIMRWMLLDDRAREGTLLNWAEDWARGACPALRQAVTDHPADPELVELASDVRFDPVAGPIYLATAASRAVHPDGAVRRVDHAAHGPGWVIVTAANPLPDIDARFVMMRFRPGTVRPQQPPPLRAGHASSRRDALATTPVTSRS